jgi:hypothetical protein
MPVQKSKRDRESVKEATRQIVGQAAMLHCLDTLLEGIGAVAPCPQWQTTHPPIFHSLGHGSGKV